jgi:Mannosyl-glycoprotein endo-beta-N-acetylglucosaminidase.
MDRLIQKTLIDGGYSPRMAAMIAAVSRHETGNYTSPVFKTLNNLFGMRFPRVRKTTALYESDSQYSVYTGPLASAIDMVYYLDARRYPRDFVHVADLVQAMKDKGYFEDSYENYLRGVKRALPKVETL